MPEQGLSTRVLRIEITADGQARVDGTAVPTPLGSSVEQVRAAALRTVVDLAAAAGGALRVDARDPDGTLWRLLVHPSGWIDDAAAASVAAPAAMPGATERRTDDPTAERIPAQYLESLVEVAQAYGAEGFEVADHLAAQVEKRIEADAGVLDAQWVRIREVRAHLSYRRGAAARATEQWIEVALAWVQLGQPNCWEAARNAHHCWLLIEDVEDVVRIGYEVASMWRQAGRDKQAQRTLLRLDQVQLDGL